MEHVEAVTQLSWVGGELEPPQPSLLHPDLPLEGWPLRTLEVPKPESLLRLLLTMVSSPSQSAGKRIVTDD